MKAWIGGRGLSLSLFGTLLLLGMVAGGTIIAQKGVGRSATLVQEAYATIGQAEALLSALKDAETGQRGYLLTGEERYLSPYRMAERTAADHLASLRQLLGERDAQEPRLQTIAGLVATKRAELDRTVRLAAEGDVAGALRVVRDGEGLALMDALREQVMALVDEEQRRLAERRQSLERADHRAIAVAVAAGLLAVVAALTAALLFRERGTATQRQLAETRVELADQVAQLQGVYNVAPVGLAFVDRERRFVALNERLAAINGRTVEAHLGRTVEEVVPGIAPSVLSLYDRVLSQGEAAIGVDIRTPPGPGEARPRDYLGNYLPVRDGSGAVIGLNIVIIDVTEQREAERQLAESEARLRAVYEAVPVGIITAELPSGRLTGGNAAVEQITGHPILLSADVDSYGEWVSYHPDGRRVTSSEYPVARMAATGEEAPEIEVLYGRGGERRWTRISARPIRSADGAITGAVVALVDIDHLKRAEEHLVREVAARTADLTAANAQLEAFAYTVSHDLRAPLRGMEGFARILLDDFAEALGPRGARYAERIVGAAERMDGLIEDLLTFSRLQRAEVRLQAMDPGLIVRAAIEDARAAAGTDADIAAEEGLPTVLAEPVVLRHVLGNLLTNAVKFRKPDERARVRLRAEYRGSRVQMIVEDEGIGIAPEHHGRVFGVFERLHGQEAYPGTGIGLAIVAAGVARMGGTVGVESEAGRGARFWIELEAAEPTRTEDTTHRA